jgi:hypothetical protein
MREHQPRTVLRPKSGPKVQDGRPPGAALLAQQDSLLMTPMSARRRFSHQKGGAAAVLQTRNLSSFTAQRALFQLQRSYGNRYLQRWTAEVCQDERPKQDTRVPPSGRLPSDQADTLGAAQIPVVGRSVSGGVASSRTLEIRLQDANGMQDDGGVTDATDGVPAAVPLSGTASGATCTPAAGISNSVCSAYSSNSWWLPLPYVNNATCACSTTPNLPEYNCIRKFLQDRLAGAPSSLKSGAAAQKSLESSSDPLDWVKYKEWVVSNLTPVIYRDHVDAYSSCCCPSGPAPYEAWVGVTTVPIPSCALVAASIITTGSCHGIQFPPSW